MPSTNLRETLSHVPRSQESTGLSPVSIGRSHHLLFWRAPSPLVSRAQAGGATVLYTVGSADDVTRAVDCGVDVILAQGWEARGHVRGLVATLPLIPAVVDAVAPAPVVASGGIEDRVFPKK
jgi:NAD(P)H-dependent flavin oxidoreductase YrpB (nitropropane dioxygenase family)